MACHDVRLVEEQVSLSEMSAYAEYERDIQAYFGCRGSVCWWCDETYGVQADDPCVHVLPALFTEVALGALSHAVSLNPSKDS